MPRILTILALLAALAGGGPVAGAQTADATHRYELPNRDALELPLPAGWQDRFDPPEEGSQPLIQLSSPSAASFSVEIEPEWGDPADDAVPDAETLRETVRSSAERLRGQTVEQALEIRRLQGADGVGFYFRATDSAPEPDEPRCMTQGALQVGRLTLWFTILTPDDRDPAIEQTLAMLRSAVYRGTGLDQR